MHLIFSCLATAVIIATLVSIAMRFLLLMLVVDMIPVLAIEIERKNEDLCFICHTDRDKIDTVKTDEARLDLKTLGLWCYFTKNLLLRLDQESTCLLHARKGWRGPRVPSLDREESQAINHWSHSAVFAPSLAVVTCRATVPARPIITL